ncbi:hypothetical protein MHI22_05655 [Lysinibacillus sp. FSL L8-0312]
MKTYCHLSFYIIEDGAAIMKNTVICLVKAKEHQPLRFPEIHFGVGKYFNFMLHKIEETYQFLVDPDVKVNALGGREKQKMEIL